MSLSASDRTCWVTHAGRKEWLHGRPVQSCVKIIASNFFSPPPFPWLIYWLRKTIESSCFRCIFVELIFVSPFTYSLLICHVRVICVVDCYTLAHPISSSWSKKETFHCWNCYCCADSILFNLWRYWDKGCTNRSDLLTTFSKRTYPASFMIWRYLSLDLHLRSQKLL